MTGRKALFLAMTGERERLPRFARNDGERRRRDCRVALLLAMTEGVARNDGGGLARNDGWGAIIIRYIDLSKMGLWIL